MMASSTNSTPHDYRSEATAMSWRGAMDAIAAAAGGPGDRRGPADRRSRLTHYIRYGYICGGRMPPLTPAVVHILLSLAGGERHGYGILKDVLRQTHDAVRLGPGTLYGTLQRLMDYGWVEETDRPARSLEADERRRYYRLTRSGREALRAEVDRLESLVRTARAQRILHRPSRG
jgi:DNA-binding PadR family transcriptional regulator